MPKADPYHLWKQAQDEHPTDQAAARIRYVELMREHGLLRPTLPGEPDTLPCGWRPTRPAWRPTRPDDERAPVATDAPEEKTNG